MTRPGEGELTYPERGLSQGFDDGAAWPAGYARVERRVLVGHGAQAYARLSRGVLAWGIQRGAGLTVRADASVQTGGRVVCGFGVGRLRLPAPCEVVWVEQPGAVVVGTDGRTVPQRVGFGYGTLPGHPASGEEAFIARLDGDGSVSFEVLAFSRPAGFIYRLGSPVTALAQRLVTRRYLRAARELAR